jgi:hypothetical protein
VSPQSSKLLVGKTSGIASSNGANGYSKTLNKNKFSESSVQPKQHKSSRDVIDEFTKSLAEKKTHINPSGSGNTRDPSPGKKTKAQEHKSGSIKKENEPVMIYYIFLLAPSLFYEL